MLFPNFRTVVTPREYAQFGELFEDIEHERFGPRGFESMVERVAALEKQLGIGDLASFTPSTQE
ncbi:MAG: hypothetical protein ACM3YO_08680 [Bacteroidota bacterium]